MTYNNISGLNITNNFAQQYITPRLFYGVGQDLNNKGQCYHNSPLYGIDETISNTITYITDPLNPSNITQVVTPPSFSNAFPFFDINTINNSSNVNNLYQNNIIDNTLTYENSISWGCVDKLNITGLQYYCTNQLWKQKTLFNIVNNINYVSKFGNPNPNFVLDYIKVADFSFGAYQSTWDSENYKCTIPAVLNMDIMYGKYGMTNNTQEGIYSIKFRMDYVYWWAKHPKNNNYIDNYFSTLNINYIFIPQDTVMWYAPGPGFILLPRNILYPFRVGTTTYGTKSAASYLNINLILIISGLLMIIF